MVLILGALTLTFLILYFSFIASEKVGYFFFASAFVFPSIFLPLLVPGGAVGVSSGGSSLFNILMIFCEGALLIIALFSIGTQKFYSPKEEILKSVAHKITIGFSVILFAMQIISAFADPQKIIPVTNVFLYLLGLVIMQKMNYEKLINAVLNVFVLLALFSLIGILLHINWGGHDLSVTDIPGGVYFSPLKSFFNLPDRVAGPLVSPQELGMFCAAGIALAVFNKSNLTYRSLVYSLLFLILGSFSGSRTFYIVFFVIILLKILSGLTIQQKSSFLPYAGIGVLAIYFMTVKVFLPLVSSSTNVNQVGGRSLLWETILAHWSDDGLLGHGPLTLEAYMHTHLGQSSYGHAHNSLLQYLWDFGIFGVVSYILFTVSWVVTMDSRKLVGINPLCMFLALQTIQSERFFLIEFSYKGITTLLLVLAVFDNPLTRGIPPEGATR